MEKINYDAITKEKLGAFIIETFNKNTIKGRKTKQLHTLAELFNKANKS